MICPKCKLDKEESEFVSHRYCSPCKSEYRKAYYKNNKSRESANFKKYYYENKESLKSSFKAWANLNKTALSEYKKKWRRINFERTKEAARKRVKEWKANNPHLVLKNRKIYDARHPEKRRARAVSYILKKTSASPEWANQFFISEIYSLAIKRRSVTGLNWHVDHIVPLRSKIVCGLHVEHNLRVIRAEENLKKGNRVWPDMP